MIKPYEEMFFKECFIIFLKEFVDTFGSVNSRMMCPFIHHFPPAFPFVNCSMVFSVSSNIVVIFNSVFTGCCGMLSITDCWTVWQALKRV